MIISDERVKRLDELLADLAERIQRITELEKEREAVIAKIEERIQWTTLAATPWGELKRILDFIRNLKEADDDRKG